MNLIFDGLQFRDIPKKKPAESSLNEGSAIDDFLRSFAEPSMSGDIFLLRKYKKDLTNRDRSCDRSTSCFIGNNSYFGTNSSQAIVTPVAKSPNQLSLNTTPVLWYGEHLADVASSPKHFNAKKDDVIEEMPSLVISSKAVRCSSNAFSALWYGKRWMNAIPALRYFNFKKNDTAREVLPSAISPKATQFPLHVPTTPLKHQNLPRPSRSWSINDIIAFRFNTFRKIQESEINVRSRWKKENSINGYNIQKLYSKYSERIKTLRRNLRCASSNFLYRVRNHSAFFSFLKRFFSYFLITIESILVAPYKLLQWICGVPLKSINFCSNFTATLLIHLLGWVDEFFRRSVDFFGNCCLKLEEKIQEQITQCLDIIHSILNILYDLHRSILERIVSVYLPNNWIQSIAIFLIKSFAIAASCSFVFLLSRNAFHAHEHINVAATNHTPKEDVLKTQRHGEVIPKRKLKYLFQNPLTLKQKEVQKTLLAFRVNAIQRYGDGTGSIAINNKILGTGSLLNEHPKIHLVKIGKHNLHFSDKYGQQYKRSIENMLE
ncbi:MAG: hypothetical protein LBB11_02200 [Puniceicoccales bacterium]|jgi:hypothetical protein|nr:hypothetical protein [Puniceicoccales bacterium]